ncbi:MAG: uracil-DNA glycosylase [Candidatus Desulforudis sp.]|nr:uracil-DNA glycosylase [Desulforudis sp.]
MTSSDRNELLKRLEPFVHRLCFYLPKPAVEDAYDYLCSLTVRPSAARTLCPRRCPDLEPHRPVSGYGSRKARLVILGEAPGEAEDLVGYPFVGPSGLVLTAALRSLGVDREQVLITNVVRCRPPGNREPHPSEQKVCTEHLKNELTDLPQGLVVLTLGNVPLKFMRQSGTPGVTSCRGILLDSFRWQQSLVSAVIPTYHPSYVLRRMNRETIDLFVRDIREALGLALALRWPAFSSHFHESS